MQPSAELSLIDSEAIRESLDRRGFWVSAPFIDAATCARIGELYDDGDTVFRSTISMARHGFGRGEYKYFGRPLPEVVARLRTLLYEYLAPIANLWSERWGSDTRWPGHHGALVERCAAVGQTRPTPLLLRYGPGDYNCLHQDLYGAIHFPLQVIVMLDRPGSDFELLLVEQRPRRQSRPIVVPVTQGSLAVIPVKERPVTGVRGFARIRVRHGVAEVREGMRRTLGVIFHDAV
jgi:hypothetical protein